MDILSVQVGSIAPLGPEGVPSGFVKRPTTARVKVAPLGLTGDAQADLKVHGGLEKAVYGYAAGHYASWCAEFPQHEALLTPGGFGENLTIAGLYESDICVGDVHRIGTAVLQVCQPRQPCFKLALYFGENRMPRAMVRSGRAGWYYRVLEPGEIGAGDAVERIDRPHPDFAFERLIAIVNYGHATVGEIERMATMPELASRLRLAAQEMMSG